MSVGSLNYLYLREPGELFDMIPDLESTETLLLQRGYDDIAKDVRRLIEYVRSAENRISVLQGQLKDVLHAVEWYLSGDYGDASLARDLEAYRNGKT